VKIDQPPGGGGDERKMTQRVRTLEKHLPVSFIAALQVAIAQDIPQFKQLLWN